MEFEIHNDIKDVVALAQTNITANGNSAGAIIDTAGYEGMEYLVLAGAITDGNYALLVEDGEDPALADAAAVPAALVLGALTGFVGVGDSDKSIRVGVVSKKRYQRLTLVATGVTAGVDRIGAIAVLNNPKNAPVAQ